MIGGLADGGGLTYEKLNLEGPLGLTCTHVDGLGPTWTNFGPVGSTWTHLKFLGLTRSHLGSLGLAWTHLYSFGLTGNGLDLLVLVTWIHLDSNWAHSGAPGCTRTQTYLHSRGLTGAFYSPLEFTYSHTTQWKRQRLSCRNGKGGEANMTFGMHLRLTETPRPRAHDTNRPHGYEGGCLWASSLPQRRSQSTWRIVFTILAASKLCCAIVRGACLRASWLAGKVSCADSCHQDGKTRTRSASMCAAASEANLSEVYAPMMFQLLYSYANTSTASSLRNASERWLPVRSVQKSDLDENHTAYCTLEATLVREPSR